MDYPTADDPALVRAVREGDEKAFEEIVRRYQRQVANALYLTVGDRELVQDLLQEVFLRVHRSLDHVAVRTSLFSWIYRIAVNLAIDEVRRKKIRKIFSLDFLTASAGEGDALLRGDDSAADRVLTDEKNEQIRRALQKLSPAHRTALVLREYEDLSYREIASILHISEQAVKSRIFRAREELKKYLSDYFQERT